MHVERTCGGHGKIVMSFLDSKHAGSDDEKVKEDLDKDYS